MRQVSLKTIKTHNIKTVFDIIAEHSNITQGDIAKCSNLSLMTVSNIVEHLDRFHIILNDDKENTGMVGRRARLLSINSEIKKIIIIDLTSLRFEFIVLNLDLSIHYSFKELEYDTDHSYEFNLEKFLLRVGKYVGVISLSEEIIGIGVSAPGPYIVENDVVINKRIPELVELKLKAMINESILNDKFSDCDVYIDEDVKFATIANAMRIPDYKTKIVYYIYIGEGVGGAVSINGNVLRGAYSFAGDIGQVLADDHNNFEQLISIRALAKSVLGKEHIDGDEEDIIRMLEGFLLENSVVLMKNFSAIYELIGRVLVNIIWVIDPHAIIIECRYAALDKEFITKLQNILYQMLSSVRHNIPDMMLSNASIKNAHIGAGIILRGRWLDSIA